MYNTIPHAGRPELLAKMEEGGEMEDVEAIVIHWITMAAADAHVNV